MNSHFNFLLVRAKASKASGKGANSKADTTQGSWAPTLVPRSLPWGYRSGVASEQYSEGSNLYLTFLRTRDAH